MRSPATITFASLAVAGLVALALAASQDERDLAFAFGVVPGLVAAELPPDAQACQRPVAVGGNFDGVELLVGTYEGGGQPLAVTVRRTDGGRILAEGRVAGGYPDFSERSVQMDRSVVRGERVAVCVRNDGKRRIALYGGPELAKRNSAVAVDGREQPTDLTLTFTTASRSALSQLPAIFDRASLFRPAWVAPWTFWLLGGLLLLAVPALLGAALRDAFRGRP
jgi:hypothetical protein